PFGLIQELLYKIKTPKLKKNAITKILSYFKYIILVFFVFIVPITYAFKDTPLPAFCKYICPAGTLEGGISILSNQVNNGYFAMLGPLFTWKFLLLVSTVVACVFIFRMFCRFICPLGALYGLFNKISFFGVKVDNHKCTNCGLCVNKCKLDIKNVGDAECINCGECINVCPTDAIRWKLTKNKPNLQNDERHKKMKIVTRIITTILMCALLITSIGCYWNESSNKFKYGTEIGDICYEAKLPIVTPDGISSETINPTKTNKITVINFWGTWCTPCVSELPDFDKIATDYKDTVNVVAIHSYSGRETASGYIKEHYPDSNIIFANDISEDEKAFSGEYYLNLGGSNAYPYTVIIDENGIITHIFETSLHYEDLKEAIESINN
ncbi:MAG: redoxin family protein, partial [Clostridia bacterium]|nr:redoxin family protein [Clostridia bacterium]